MTDVLNYLKSITALLIVIVILLFYKVVFIDTPGVNAGSRWSDVNIAAVGGNPVHGDSIRTEPYL